MIQLRSTDINPGDGNCDDGSGNCTLLAAISSGNDFIDVLGGQVGNFPFAQFPVPVVTSQTIPTTTSVITAPSTSGVLPSTGTSLLISLGFSLSTTLLGSALTIRQKSKLNQLK